MDLCPGGSVKGMSVQGVSVCGSMSWGLSPGGFMSGRSPEEIWDQRQRPLWKEHGTRQSDRK